MSGTDRYQQQSQENGLRGIRRVCHSPWLDGKEYNNHSQDGANVCNMVSNKLFASSFLIPEVLRKVEFDRKLVTNVKYDPIFKLEPSCTDWDKDTIRKEFIKIPLHKL